jgi:TolA-binding protein
MLLVVSIGLWYFPSRRRGPDATGSTVMTPDLEGEVGPSATLTPADPLDLDIDPRTGRLRTREELDQRQAAARAAAVDGRDPLARSGEADDGIALRAIGQEAQDQQVDLEERERGNVDRLADLAAAGPDPMPAAPAPPTTAEDDSLATPTARGGNVQGTISLDQLDRAEGAAYGSSSSGSRNAVPQQAPSQQAPSQQAAPQREQAQQAAPANAQEAYARGMQRYQQGNYGGAAEDFARVYRNPEGSQNLVPSALHHMARSYRQARSCRVAVTHYRSLISRFPQYDGTPRAMIELADCYRTLGRLSDARATLEQAQRYASVAAEARHELLHVRQMERASRRRMMPREASEPAAAEAAY